MTENPRCPRCRSWKSVVWVTNPHGGYMLRCTKCKLEWIENNPRKEPHGRHNKIKNPQNEKARLQASEDCRAARDK